MNREDAVRFLTGLPKLAGKASLERIKKVLNDFGNPQESLRVIHIAGTNGKGSTAAMVAQMLLAAGYRVGLFVSPYIHRFEERIQINGQPIDGVSLAALTERILPYGAQLSAFEAITAVGFLYFKESKCDWVVLETGLGGRFDATNTVSQPVLSVLTTIDLDHTELLGDTVAQIAGEKCGIIRTGGCVVSAPHQDPEALAVIRAVCAQCRAQLAVAKPAMIVSEEIGVLRICHGGETYSLAMTAHYQAENAATALCVAEQLGIPTAARRAGLERAVLPGRFEWVQKNVLLDGAHNPNGVAALCKSLRRITHPEQVTVVLGMLPDKNREAALPLLAQVCHKMIVVPVHTARGDDGRALFAMAQNYIKEVSYCTTVQEALLNVQTEIACVCGSLYLLGEI